MNSLHVLGIAVFLLVLPFIWVELAAAVCVDMTLGLISWVPSSDPSNLIAFSTFVVVLVYRWTFCAGGPRIKVSGCGKYKHDYLPPPKPWGLLRQIGILVAALPFLSVIAFLLFGVSDASGTLLQLACSVPIVLIMSLAALQLIADGFAALSKRRIADVDAVPVVGRMTM